MAARTHAVAVFVLALILGATSQASADLSCLLLASTQTVASALQVSHQLRTLRCFNPSAEPKIAAALKPRADLHETEETIRSLHQLIWSYRDLIDPRLVYYRLLGESGGDPRAQNPRSTAYGLFQRIGSRSELLKLEKRFPRVSPRLLQVRDYLEGYVKRASLSRGCRGKSFDRLSAIEKSMYLGWGNCQSEARERALCKTNDHYRSSGACEIIAPLYSGRPAPLCSYRVNP